jgi:hypothetical protein
VNTTIVIESNVPIPTKSRAKGKGKWEFIKTLAVGQSFLAPYKKGPAIASHAKHLGIKVTTRRASPTECRVWRVE